MNDATMDSNSVRQRLSLDRGWRFHLGDVPFPEIKGHHASFDNAKAGQAWGAAAGDFDDSQWRRLDLPHDWAIEGDIDPAANLAQGFRRRGIGWYRRYFRLDPADRGKHLELQFDGVATHCAVWVNGIVSARNWCGYASFAIDITPIAAFGDDVNCIAVRVDADAMEGWWYEGAGLYRHTWLLQRDAVHIATDGVYANPVKRAEGRWEIPVEVTLESCAKETAEVIAESVLLDGQGREVARGSAAAARVEPFERPVARMTLAVENPRLWSIDEPTLYTVRTTLRRGATAIDGVETRCGFRTIRFDAATGFYLNEQPLKLQGTCNHQDHAGVGVAVPEALWDFRIRRLKEMGSNAYRCSHNPPAAEFLDACDRLGMLVMDENRNFGTSATTLAELEWLVRRDRNHPSVILWSVFNEEPMQCTPQGYEMVRRMSAVVKRLDTTRPVTAAQNYGQLSEVNASQAADVAGFNYSHWDYDAWWAAGLNKPAISSEDTSAVMTRGEYITDESKHILASYDDEWRPWGLRHRDAWREIARRPYMAGGFVWTGFDYRGEPQPLEWPATGSSFGCMDQCGFPKAAFYIHQALWMKDRPILQLIPHWNWPNRAGEEVQVMALTNAAQVTLRLNGKVISTRPVDPFDMVSWKVPYEAGRLEAIALDGDGKEVAHCVVETTGEPAALRLTADRPTLNGDGADAQPIAVDALDAQGRHVPTANLPVTFEISGPAKIIGVANGDPLDHASEKSDTRLLFNGLAQVIVQSRANVSGPMTLHATAPGLQPATLQVNVLAALARPALPPVDPPVILRLWKMSPAFATAPDPNLAPGKTDMNTWVQIATGPLQPFINGGHAIFRTTFLPRATQRRDGAMLILRKLTGKADVYLDGQRVAQKADFVAGTLRLPLSSGEGRRTVSILIESPAGASVGLGGSATVEELSG